MNKKLHFRVADLIVSAFLVYLWYNPSAHIALVKVLS